MQHSVSSTRRFYVALGLAMTVIALAGFWPTYFGPLVTGTIASPPIIHLHAIVFSGWLALFIVQVGLAATGHRRAHIRLGRIGIGYGIMLIVVGLTTGVIRSRLPDGGVNAGLFFSANADMLVYAAFFSLAVVWRKRPSLHKRAMVVAASMLLIAAVGRLWFLPPGSTSSGFALRLLIHVAPVVAAIAYDLWRRRGIHPVYIAGLVAFFLRRYLAGPVSGADAWIDFSTWSLDFWGV